MWAQACFSSETPRSPSHPPLTHTHTYTHTHTHTHTYPSTHSPTYPLTPLTHSLTYVYTHTLFHSLTLYTNLHTHSLTLTLTPSHTHTQGVAVDESRGHLYITDAGYNCLLCISLTTFEPIPSFGQSGEVPLINPSSVAVDRDGFVLVTSAKSHLLSIISPQGSKVKQLGAEGVLLKSPSSVCVDQTGNVIVVDNAVPCIYIF